MPYAAPVIDLTNAGEQTVIDQGIEMSSISLLSFPPGAQFDMRIGDGPYMPVFGAFAMEVCGREDATRGLYVRTTTPQPGVRLNWFVPFADGLRPQL